MKKHKISNLIRWSLLLVALTISALLILTFYNGIWGFGEWSTSSILGHHEKYGHGPGYIRMKQLVIAFLGGGALAFAGVMLQKVTRNNLAEVSILGIGSINILFIFAYVFLFQNKVFENGIIGALLPLVTITASIMGTLIVWVVSRSKRANKNTFVIIGIALQLLFEALSVVFVNPSQLRGKKGKEIWNIIKNYTMGQVRVDDNGHPIPYWLILTAFIVIAIVIIITIFLRKKIDIYESSEESATALGIKVGSLRLTIFILVALLAGIEATILGTVALLGIIAPSIARLIFKNKFLPLAISSFIIGGILVILATFISTGIGTDLPPGILSTAIAAPYFIFLIFRGK